MNDAFVADFHMILWNRKTGTAPTPEDVKYIVQKFTEAAHDRGLIYGGSCEVREAKEVDLK